MPGAFAVLTGDVIGFSALDAKQQQRVMAALRVAAEQIADWGAIRHGTHFTPNRGDGWQIVVQPPALALRAALFLKAALRRNGKEYDTRISIATGAAEIPADGNLNLATGPAFVASGRGLDSLPRSTEMCHADGGAIAAATRLADHICRDWTPAQARALEYMFPPAGITQEKLASTLGISQQAVQQALAAAGFPAMSDALALIETEGHTHHGNSRGPP